MGRSLGLLDSVIAMKTRATDGMAMLESVVQGGDGTWCAKGHEPCPASLTSLKFCISILMTCHLVEPRTPVVTVLCTSVASTVHFVKSTGNSNLEVMICILDGMEMFKGKVKELCLLLYKVV
ncbi:hypothetical protein Syun_021952 [Stephania yunnanensis]|uniref:Uncharacterized protein n=1 Tax=Stephania yunnanensis TaxID=152371 RepID=A0AAP0IHC1_9MAGN